MTKQKDGFSSDYVGRTEHEQRFGGGKSKHRHVFCDDHESLCKHTTSEHSYTICSTLLTNTIVNSLRNLAVLPLIYNLYLSL